MDTVIEVDGVHVEYGRRRRRSRRAGRSQPGRAAAKHVIQGVDFSIDAGETLSLVGESGSGKSTIGRAILGLTPVSAGRIRLHGQDLTALSRRRRRASAAGLQAVFQDPYSSLNPAMTVENILLEPLLVRGVADARALVHDVLARVGLPGDAGRRLASEFSGGQRQRIAIARALVLGPRLVVCDEPTSALDVSTQGRILELLHEIQQRTGVAYLFISHDLRVVRRISDRIAVLQAGKIVETGPAEQVMSDPQHAYTRRLLLSTPLMDPVKQARRRAERRQAAMGETERRALHA